jgi:hypothetical protein
MHAPLGPTAPDAFSVFVCRRWHGSWGACVCTVLSVPAALDPKALAPRLPSVEASVPRLHSPPQTLENYIK